MKNSKEYLKSISPDDERGIRKHLIDQGILNIIASIMENYAEYVIEFSDSEIIDISNEEIIQMAYHPDNNGISYPSYIKGGKDIRDKIMAYISRERQERQMLFHECKHCNNRCNCVNQPCTCCKDEEPLEKETEVKNITTEKPVVLIFRQKKSHTLFGFLRLVRIKTKKKMKSLRRR